MRTVSIVPLQIIDAVCGLVRRMVNGELPLVMHHTTLIKETVAQVPGTDGRQAWNILMTVIGNLRRNCPAWKNRFSDKAWGKDCDAAVRKFRVLEYNPHACDKCERRIDCLTIKPVWSEVLNA
jgi:hypothetical protein